MPKLTLIPGCRLLCAVAPPPTVGGFQLHPGGTRLMESPE